MPLGGALPPTLVRGAGFFAFWLVLIGAGHLPSGLATAAAASWLSLRLLPAGSLRLRPLAAAALLARVAEQSLRAGWDVARRALDPRLPLRPGFVAHRVGLPPGPTRELFLTLTSLAPGALPAGEDGDTVLYHCLDVAQPVAAQLARDEAALVRALGGPARDA